MEWRNKYVLLNHIEEHSLLVCIHYTQINEKKVGQFLPMVIQSSDVFCDELGIFWQPGDKGAVHHTLHMKAQ